MNVRSAKRSRKVIAIVVSAYPRITNTFIDQEIAGLEKRGLELCIFALWRSNETSTVSRSVCSPVNYLPGTLLEQPSRLLKAIGAALANPNLLKCIALLPRDCINRGLTETVRRFGQALVMSHELSAQISWIHCHFLHGPASVSRYVSTLSGHGWSFSAHAKDIWTSSLADIREKVRSASWGVTCTHYNAEYLHRTCDPEHKTIVSYHGIDLRRLTSGYSVDGTRSGTIANRPCRLISVCRAVEKKGIDTMLHALARLPKRTDWHLTHIGTGADLEKLKELAQELKLSHRIKWLGICDPQQVISLYQQSDLFVLAARVAKNGDRDGLPNVLMEAQALGLCCVATNVSAVPELITHKETGWLVEPDDADALSAALVHLISEPKERQKIASRGMQHVRSKFKSDVGIDQIFQRLQSCSDIDGQESSLA